jgi:hypothetical protein
MNEDKKWAKMIAKTWADEDYKARLIAEPARVLKEEGIDVPDDVEIRVVENTSRLSYLVLPVKPQDNAKFDELQTRIAAGCGGNGGNGGFF